MERLLGEVAKRCDSNVTAERSTAVTVGAVLSCIEKGYGADTALQILSRVPRALAQTPPGTLLSLTASAQQALQWSQLSLEVLEKYDEYFWSHRPDCVFPQLRKMFEVEMTASSKPEAVSSKAVRAFLKPLNLPGRAVSAKKANEQNLYLSAGNLAFDLSSELPVSCEDGDGHWGVRTALNKQICGACALPVCEEDRPLRRLPPETRATDLAVEEMSRIVVFPCGHACHRGCNPQMACLQCLRKASGELRKDQHNSPHGSVLRLYE